MQEESKESVLQFNGKHVIYRDEQLEVYPLKATGDEGDCYSFIGVPVTGNGRFLPQVATKLGCNPKIHFRTLSEGQSVTLPNGTVVHPSQVTDVPEPAKSFVMIFLPNPSYVDLFIANNLRTM